MTKEEYETELKTLYGKALKDKDLRLAFDILVRGRDIDDIQVETKEKE